MHFFVSSQYYADIFHVTLVSSTQMLLTVICLCSYHSFVITFNKANQGSIFTRVCLRSADKVLFIFLCCDISTFFISVFAVQKIIKAKHLPIYQPKIPLTHQEDQLSVAMDLLLNRYLNIIIIL